MKPLTIIALGPNKWDGPWMNRQQLMSRLGKYHRVLYSTGIMSTWDFGTNQWRSAPLFSQFENKDSVTIHTPGKIPLLNNRLKKYQKYVLSKEIGKWKKQIDWNQSQSITYVFGPGFKDYMSTINSKFIVYHVYDLFEKNAGWSDAKDLEHRWFLDNADIILASSELMAKHIEQISKRKANLLENGVDYKAFSCSTHEIPPDLKSIPRPVIMHVGNLNRKIDFSLVKYIAERKKKWHWVFVGGLFNLDESDKTNFNELKNRKNVHFLGNKPHTELPAYVNHADINVMIYKEDPELWTNAGFPLKLNEYLAVGKPVVSVGLPTILKYDGLVKIAKGGGQWIGSIENTLVEDSKPLILLMKKTAEKNDWNNKVLQINKWIEKLFHH